MSQIAYDNRAAVTYGFHFGSEVSSSRKRKLDDCSIASTTSRTPLMKSFRFVSLLLGRFQRTAKRFQSKLADESGAAGSGRFARYQPAPVAAAKGVSRQPLGSRAIRFDQQRGKMLSLRLIAETVHKILRRELIRRRRLIAKQIANGMIVLAMRQAAETRPWSDLPRAGRLLLAIPQSL